MYLEVRTFNFALGRPLLAFFLPTLLFILLDKLLFNSPILFSLPPTLLSKKNVFNMAEMSRVWRASLCSLSNYEVLLRHTPAFMLSNLPYFFE